MNLDFNSVLSLMTNLNSEDVLAFLDSVEKTLEHAKKTVQEIRETTKKFLKIRDTVTKTAKIIRDMR